MILRGFSLLELIVDIAILSILLVLLYLLVDPLTQLHKAQDATRKHDLTQLQNALDTYYNDNGCYPTTIPFGTEWREGSTVYMSEVPQDDSCDSNPSMCYMYQINTAESCPQWNILYAKQEVAKTASCPLSTISSSCTPPNYDPSFACTISGSVDCSFIGANPVIPSHGSPGNPNSGSSPSYPPSSSTSCPQSERHYTCTGGPTARCNIVPAGTGVYCASDCEGAC